MKKSKEPDEFCLRIQLLMDKHKCSVAELAKRLSVSKGFVSGLRLYTTTSVSDNMLGRVAEALGLDRSETNSLQRALALRKGFVKVPIFDEIGAVGALGLVEFNLASNKNLSLENNQVEN